MQLHRRPLSVLALLLAGCAATDNAEVPRRSRTVRKYDIATFQQTINVGGTSISPDGGWLLLTSNESGVFNVYRLPLAGGERQQLTQSTSDATTGIAWLDDTRFLLTKDQGGNELHHVYVQSIEGEAVDLTPGERLKARVAGIAEDRTAFVLYSNERDARAFDVYRYTVPHGGAEASAAEATAGEATAGEATAGAQKFARERIFENNGGYDPGVISRDLRFVVLEKAKNNEDNDLYLWDATRPDEAPKHITPHEGAVSHSASAFTPDGKKLLYLSDKDSDFHRAWSYDLASGTHELVAERAWDISSIGFTRCGRYRTMVVNEDATPKLEVTEAATGAGIALPELDGKTISSVQTSHDGTWVLAYASSPTSVSDLWVGKTLDSTLERRTSSMPEAIDPADLVAPQVVRYESFDRLRIPAILYRPHTASPAQPAPALVWVHGGPGGQSNTAYRATIQFLVNNGYAVLMVNNRGSSGYGKTFYHLDDRKHGEDDLKDCVAGRRYLKSLDWVDGKRVGIIGGSYGGYMVAAALAFEPDAFDVGVDIFGVTNWLRTLESIPPWWASFRDALYAEMGDPKTDRERLRRISPLFHAANIKKPLLVVQGANDPRVLKVESDELVAAVQKNGVPVEYLVFDDEGHGFRNKKNAMAADRRIVEFLDRYLR